MEHQYTLDLGSEVVNSMLEPLPLALHTHVHMLWTRTSTHALFPEAFEVKLQTLERSTPKHFSMGLLTTRTCSHSTTIISKKLNTDRAVASGNSQSVDKRTQFSQKCP
jgi:hypothetical protein